MSHLTAKAEPPAAVAFAVAPSPLISTKATVPPSSASRFATAAPIPWAAPVTTATRPVNLFMSVSLLCGLSFGFDNGCEQLIFLGDLRICGEDLLSDLPEDGHHPLLVLVAQLQDLSAVLNPGRIRALPKIGRAHV